MSDSQVTFILRRDGKEVFRGQERECIDYIHRMHSFSFSHALRYEGYTMEKLVEPQAPPKTGDANDQVSL